MAYFSQEQKKKIAPKIKEILKQYELKGTLRIKNHSTIVLTIRSGKLDFIGNYAEVNKNRSKEFQSDIEYIKEKKNISVNHYYIDNSFSGKCKEVLIKLKNVLNTNNYDNSEPMVDYFDVGHYISIEIGEWNRPYEFLG